MQSYSTPFLCCIIFEKDEKSFESLEKRIDDYRFGYNGQQKDNEIAGLGNHNTALFWEYDTRLGRRWNIDPVVKSWESPYATFGNTPISHNDILGDHDDKSNANNPNKNNYEGLVASDPRSGTTVSDEAREIGGIVVRPSAEQIENAQEQRQWRSNNSRILGREDYSSFYSEGSAGDRLMTGQDKARWFFDQMAVVGIASAPQLTPTAAKPLQWFAEDGTPLQVELMGAGKTRDIIKNWLKGLTTISRSKAMKDVEDAGFKKVYEEGERVNYTNGNYNIRFDPPGDGVDYYHMQIEYGSGRSKISYDANLNRVKSNKSAAHIRTNKP